MSDDRRACVAVVGSLNADHRVNVAHIPAPGETVLASSVVVAAGGKGANQAIAAARAGAAARIISRSSPRLRSTAIGLGGSPSWPARS